MPDKLKSEASPFRDIAETVAAKYFRPQEIDTAISKNLARSECTRSNEEIVRLAVEATNQAVIKEWNQAMTSSAFDKRLHQLDYFEIAELMATLAEKERTK